MKKIIGIMMSLIMVACVAGFFSACGNDKTSGSQSESSVTESREGSESTSGGETEENSQSTESQGGSGTTSEKPQGELTIVSPSGEVYPYIENVKKYLSAGNDAKVEDYYVKTENAYAPVTIEWKNTYKNVETIKIEYSLNSDFSEAETAETEGHKTRYNLYNLYKASKYYVRVTAYIKGGETATAVSEFETTDNGPRMMKIDGIYNVRDLGGYLTESGERTKQGLFYRGGALSKSTIQAFDFVSLTEKGKKFMSEELGVKTDVDLRSAAENLNLTESPIPEANLEYYGVGGYLSAFSDKEGFARLFAALSDKSRYPVYMHCTGGADRTGTVSFLINALLGVDERTLIQDYELTSFSVYSGDINDVRSINSKVYSFKPFVEKLKTFEGETLSEKTKNYMLSIGVTETQIYNIKAIMLGKPVKTSVSAQSVYTVNGEKFEIRFGGEVKDVQKVVIDGKTVKFTRSGNVVTVLKDDMPEGMIAGKINGKVVADGLEYSFSFVYDDVKRVWGINSASEITLSSETDEARGTVAVGYDGTVAETQIKSIAEANSGGTFFFIGSYAVHYRGGGFRAATLKDNGVYAEPSDRVWMNKAAPNLTSGAKIGFSVTVKNENTVILKIFVNDALSGTAELPRVADEIAEENAVFGVKITSGFVTKLVITK